MGAPVMEDPNLPAIDREVWSYMLPRVGDVRLSLSVGKEWRAEEIRLIEKRGMCRSHRSNKKQHFMSETTFIM